MSSSSPTRRFLLPVVIGGLLLQGVVGMVPHHHAAELTHTGVSLANHWCSHTVPELFPAPASDRTAICLVCVIPTPAFDQPTDGTLVVAQISTAAEPVASDRSGSLARRWQHQLRGPPARA